MQVNNKHYRTIWVHPEDETIIQVIDQRYLPHQFVIESLTTVQQVAQAISEMHVRGAGLIGAAAGYGMYLATLESRDKPNFDDHLRFCADMLLGTRPTAVNLKWAVSRQIKQIDTKETIEDKIRISVETANLIAEEDIAMCQSIGRYGLEIIEEIASFKDGPVNILTHCNAGWLAFVDYGTATSPIYLAHSRGIDVHVWIDETRPRNQGSRLTAWELGQHGVPHTIIADNTGGHLMQHDYVDLVITGTDRTTREGDVANKIGTYLKALAAFDNNVPFYVALPSSTIDWSISNGLSEIPIEERSGDEVKYIQGQSQIGIQKVLLAPKESAAMNFGFDVTPSRLITGLITERGICDASAEGLSKLFPECKV